MTATADGPKPDLLEAAFELVAEHGWRGFKLTDLAHRTKKSLPEMYDELPSRQHLLPALGRRLDRAMLTGASNELLGLSPRERLFELLMCRFEAMAPFRDGLARMARDGVSDLGSIAASLCNIARFTGWLVEAADLELSPVRQGLARQALGVVYVRVFKVWLRDDSPDRAATMAELDKRLQQLERLANMGRGFRRRRPEGEPEAEPS